MLFKTISKNFLFVISFFFVCFIAASCDLPISSGDETQSTFSKSFEKPKVVGRIKTRQITESSGLVASRCNKNVFWTHNDSGNGAYIYALTSKGELLGTWKVKDANNKDWEDIATFKTKSGACFLYIGDIGNNLRRRETLTIYKIKEPTVTNADKISSKKRPQTTDRATRINFSYPDIRHNAETLLAHPKTGDLYILTKRVSGASGIYQLDATKLKNKNTLKKIGNISLPALPNGLLTGGEISPDGKHVILCDYFNAYEYVLPKNTEKFNDIWKTDPSLIRLGKREQGEAICYSVDMKSIFATSEKRNSSIIEVKRKSGTESTKHLKDF